MLIICLFVNKVLKVMHFERRAALILDMVVLGEFFGKAGKDASIQFVKKEVRKVFTAWHLFKRYFAPGVPKFIRHQSSALNEGARERGARIYYLQISYMGRRGQACM